MTSSIVMHQTKIIMMKTNIITNLEMEITELKVNKLNK
jgi:hypothetical protein